MANGKLILIGAGPGAIDLITVRGLEALRSADVILYDALVNTDLLKYAKPDADIRYTGKRAGQHSFKQAEINQLIVELAKEKGVVVRLKGGDAFVFGRGYEEMTFAKEHGLDVEVIPGVSSAYSVPALQGIPLTHRGLSRGVRIVTASTEQGTLSEDILNITDANQTLVVFMGLQHLDEIVDQFKSFGAIDTPVAVIQSGSTSNERIAIGTISSISEEVRVKHLAAPALIVIGDVVSLHPEFQKQEVNV